MQKFLFCLVFFLFLTACGQTGELAPTPTLGAAVPYQTLALTATPTAPPTLTPALTNIVLPTATIYTYTVVQGDTLSSIARRTGVSLDALLATNPGIPATALAIGTKLIIPTGNTAPGQPSPTPAALLVKQAHCWSEATGGLWCFALVQNDYAETLENLSAQFALADAGGQQIASQTAYGLLDILPSGAAMPLAAHFAAPVQPDAVVHVQVLTATRLLPGDTRYLPVVVENSLASMAASGQTARVAGQVVLSGTGTAKTLWILAVAYDQAGNVVGVRRWESAAALTADTPVPFDFPITSVGPGIARVEFIVEARP